MRCSGLLLVLALGVTGRAGAQDRTVIRMAGSLEGLPFSSAVRAGDLLYLSGQIGVPPGGEAPAPGGIGPDATSGLARGAAVEIECLALAGSSR